jgi:hypothetical protein
MKSCLIILSCFLANVIFPQKLKTSDVQGTWKLLWSASNLPYLTEEVPEIDSEEGNGNRIVYAQNEFWEFRQKEVYFLNYPCCIASTGKLSTKDTTLQIRFESSYSNDLFYRLELHNDTLIASEFNTTYYLVRDTLESESLSLLLKKKINPECFYGKWEIPVGEVSVPYDAILVWYPWKMVDTFVVNTRNINWYWKKNRFYLDVDGEKRAFKVKGFSEDLENLTLVPDSWVRYYIRRDKLDAYVVEHVWLRRIED